MSDKLIVGNWKMNMLLDEAKLLVDSILKDIGSDYDSCNVVLAPPYTALRSVYENIKDSRIELGAQDVFWELSGAYTGEISVNMLLDTGCTWVIIGHSERRHLLGESEELISKKVITALENGLNVILCVGETEKQKVEGQTINVIKKQLESAFSEDAKKYVKKIFIAYEPVWAIGTGKIARPNEIINIHQQIKQILTGLFGNDGNNISLLYGGSVSPENIGDFIHSRFVNGALVGGASLKADKFTEIIKKAGV